MCPVGMRDFEWSPIPQQMEASDVGMMLRSAALALLCRGETEDLKYIAACCMPFLTSLNGCSSR